MSHLIKYFELVAFLCSILAWQSLKRNRSMSLFPVLLGFICALEWTGYYLKMRANHQNVWLYNVCGPLLVFFYCTILGLSLKSKTKRNLIFIMGTIFLMAAVYRFVFLSMAGVFNIITYSFGSIVICIGALLVIGEMISGPLVFKIFQNPFFYILSALVVYYLATLPYFTMNNWVGKIEKGRMIKQILINCMALLNYLLYSTYSIAFLWMKKKDAC